ncbi:MAG: TIGR03752 family integrating conjugative element protein, partial [Dehalococcoidia bacterium]
AGAFAAGETTSVVGGALGTVTNTVDGNAGKFVAGEALRGGASNAQRWVEERLGQSLDVIFVPPGGRVTINVREMIEIDYDTEGRRVSYAKPAVDPYRSQGLD